MNNITIKKFDFFKKLTALPFIKAIILYGSRAREDFKDRSDIDLAIDCPDAKESDWLKVLTIIEQADTLLKIDCVRLDTLAQDNPLRLSILKDGVYLYKKNLP